MKRRSRVAWAFPSERSPEPFVDGVMCEVDEAWSSSRYFSKAGSRGLSGGRPPGRLRPSCRGGAQGDRDEPRAREQARGDIECETRLQARDGLCSSPAGSYTNFPVATNRVFSGFVA